MTEKKIDSFYQPTAMENATADENDEAARKRSRSVGSSSNSPVSKKAVLSESFSELPNEAPLWLTQLTAAMDRMTQKISDVSDKCDNISTKFDGFTRAIDARVTEFTNEITAKVAEVEKSVEFVAEEFDKQKKTNKLLESQIANLKEELRASIAASIEATDALEQYSRRNCALLHGVPERKDEKTDNLFIKTIADHLGVGVKARDIDRSHRIGAKRTNGTARPIIVKFARYNVRARVFKEKRKFKGTKLMLTESLTKRRVSLLNEARDRFGKENVWSSDGEILTSKDGKTYNVTLRSIKIILWSLYL